MLSVFTVVPFIAPYNVANVGLTEAQLPLIYFAGGFTTLFTAQIIGYLADKYGKKRVFTIVAFLSLIPILLMTHLGRVPLLTRWLRRSCSSCSCPDASGRRWRWSPAACQRRCAAAS